MEGVGYVLRRYKVIDDLDTAVEVLDLTYRKKRQCHNTMKGLIQKITSQNSGSGHMTNDLNKLIINITANNCNKTTCQLTSCSIKKRYKNINDTINRFYFIKN